MVDNAITQLEKELVFILKEEYSFYQSLYIMLDRQKDLIRFQKEDKLLDLYTEIERCHKRIAKSEEKIRHLKEKNPKLFKMASVSPNVRKVINSIVTLVKKSIVLVGENEEYLKGKYDRIKDELQELKHSEKILKYMQADNVSPQFVDGKN